MSNEKTCEACGAPNDEGFAYGRPGDCYGAALCAGCANHRFIFNASALSIDGKQGLLAERIRARRAERSAPTFVDRNGVEIRIGDRVFDRLGLAAGTLLHTSDPDFPVHASMRRDDGHGGNGHKGAWLIRLTDLERIDPPADEGKSLSPKPKHCEHVFSTREESCVYCGTAAPAMIAPVPSRYMLIDRLLGEAGYLPPPEGYGDFERDRVTRMVDAQAALLARLERDLGMVAMLGPMFCRTAGDCEP